MLPSPASMENFHRSFDLKRMLSLCASFLRGKLIGTEFCRESPRASFSSPESGKWPRPLFGSFDVKCALQLVFRGGLAGGTELDSSKGSESLCVRGFLVWPPKLIGPFPLFDSRILSNASSLCFSSVKVNSHEHNSFGYWIHLFYSLRSPLFPNSDAILIAFFFF